MAAAMLREPNRRVLSPTDEKGHVVGGHVWRIFPLVDMLSPPVDMPCALGYFSDVRGPLHEIGRSFSRTVWMRSKTYSARDAGV